MGGGGCACRKAVQPCRRPWQSRLPPGRSWMHASLAHWHVLSLSHRHACRAQRGSESGVPPHLLRKDFFIDCKLKEASGFGIHREVAGEHLDKAFQLLRSRRTWRAPNLKGEHQISRASIKSQGRASHRACIGKGTDVRTSGRGHRRREDSPLLSTRRTGCMFPSQALQGRTHCRGRRV